MTSAKKNKKAVAGGFHLPTTPRRTVVAPDTEQRFASRTTAAEGAAAQTSSTPAVQQPATVGRGMIQRKRRGAVRRLMVYLPPDIGMALEEHAFRQRRDISDVVTEAVRALLANQAAGNPASR